MHVTAVLWLQSKHNLKTIIPSIFVPPISRVPPVSTSSVSTSPKCITPPLRVLPYHIIHDKTLADRMMSSLNKYLESSPTGGDSPSPQLRTFLDMLPMNIQAHSVLSNGLSDEASASTAFWGCFQYVIGSAVQEIDRNVSVPRYIQSQRPALLSESQSPDSDRTSPSPGVDPRLLREDKSPSVFARHAPKIVGMGKAITNGQHGSPLYYRKLEHSHRSLLVKIGAAMIASPGSPIPYAILFGGDQFMLFSLFRNVDTNGTTRFGLFCSDIIETSSRVYPIIPLAIFTLLGKDGLAALTSSSIPIPPVTQNQEKKFWNKRTPKSNISQSIQRFMHKKHTLRTSFDSPYVAALEGFVLSRRPSTRQYSAIPSYHTSICAPRSTQQRGSQFDYKRHFSSVANNSTSGDGSGPNSTPLPSPDTESTEPDLILYDLLGHGAAGYVFLGVAEDGSPFAVKVAPQKNGREMLSNEAFIYDHLSQLQGECVPEMFGLFSCKEFDALVMEFVGRIPEKMDDLSVTQRRGLYEDLCRIHKNGVQHGDIRLANVALPEGSKPRFIDFSHSSLHDCEGPEDCDELLDAYDILLLDTDQSEA